MNAIGGITKETGHKTLGNSIKELRVEKGLSQIELAKAAGIPAATLCRYEKGERTRPKAQHLLAIAAALEASPEYIIHGTGEKSIESVTADLAVLIADIKSLSPDKLAMISAAVKAIK